MSVYKAYNNECVIRYSIKEKLCYLLLYVLYTVFFANLTDFSNILIMWSKIKHIS